MESLPEFVGTVHIFLGPYRGNPIALYLQRDEAQCHISPRMYPWNRTVGSGETPNKAAAAFEAKWKEGDLSTEMYSGPHWEGGIKPEKPKPPPKPAAPKPAKPATSVSAQPSSTPSAPTASPPTPASTSQDVKKNAPPPDVPSSNVTEGVSPSSENPQSAQIKEQTSASPETT